MPSGSGARSVKAMPDAAGTPRLMRVAVPTLFPLGRTSRVAVSALPSLPFVLPQGWLSVWFTPIRSGQGCEGLRLADVVLVVLPGSFALEVTLRTRPLEPLTWSVDADWGGNAVF